MKRTKATAGIAALAALCIGTASAQDLQQGHQGLSGQQHQGSGQLGTEQKDFAQPGLGLEGADRERFGQPGIEQREGERGQQQQRLGEQPFGHQRSLGQQQQAEGDLFQVSQLKDAQVNDAQGNSLGQIDQVLVDAESGKVRFAAVKGQDGKHVAIPWEALEIRKEGEQQLNVKLNASKEKFDQAPTFSETDIQQLSDRQTAQSIYSHWDVQPDQGMMGTQQPGTGISPRSGTESPRVGTPDEGTQPQVGGQEQERQGETGTQTEPGRGGLDGFGPGTTSLQE